MLFIFQKDQAQRGANTDSVPRAKRPTTQPGAYCIDYILYELKFIHVLKQMVFALFRYRSLAFLFTIFLKTTWYNCYMYFTLQIKLMVIQMT